MPADPTLGGGDPIRVMICDDSAAVRTAIGRMLEGEPAVRVVARVGDGSQAVAEVTRRRRGESVDVLLLDIDMPVMDGMTALPLLLRADPELRILVVSTLSTRGADLSLRALSLGAADYVAKPSAGDVGGHDAFRAELVAKVKGQGRLHRRDRRPASVPGARPPMPAATRRPPLLLAIGASTGGPQALFSLVQALGRVPVPVTLTQHMPAVFIPILANHISQLGVMPCTEARDGQALLPGEIVMAPGDRHLLVARVGARLLARVTTDPPENFCRPAVDPMLRSAAIACEGRVLVVMLTGMGQDGLAGTTAVVRAGGAAIAQDEATSVVWGMPGAIAQAGLCHAVLPLGRIGAAVLELLGAVK